MKSIKVFIPVIGNSFNSVHPQILADIEDLFTNLDLRIDELMFDMHVEVHGRCEKCCKALINIKDDELSLLILKIDIDCTNNIESSPSINAEIFKNFSIFDFSDVLISFVEGELRNA